jgi:hypothetical protein
LQIKISYHAGGASVHVPYQEPVILKSGDTLVIGSEPEIHQVSAWWGSHFHVAYSANLDDAKRQVVKKINKTLRFWYSDPPKIKAHQIDFKVKGLYAWQAGRDMPRAEVFCDPGTNANVPDRPAAPDAF